MLVKWHHFAIISGTILLLFLSNVEKKQNNLVCFAIIIANWNWVILGHTHSHPLKSTSCLCVIYWLDFNNFKCMWWTHVKVLKFNQKLTHKEDVDLDVWRSVSLALIIEIFFIKISCFFSVCASVIISYSCDNILAQNMQYGC